MIPILHRYIAKTVISSTLLVILIVLGLAYFIGFLQELRDIGEGDYGVLQIALHSLLTLPRTIYQIFPMLVLLGGLMGLGLLAANQELVIMRISGMSIFRISRAVFAAALLLIVMGLIMGELIAPRAYFLANKYKSNAQSNGQAVQTASGVWLHEGNDFFHIDRVMSHHHLEGVTRYEFDNEHHLLAAYHANKMNYQDGGWELSDLVQTEFKQDQTQHQEFDHANWRLTLNPTLLNVGLVEPDELPIYQLAGYAQHLSENGLQASEFKFNFWKRVFQPLIILVMLLLAIPFVFAAPRSVSMGWRMLMGVIVGFAFYIVNALIGQISIVFQFSPFVAALLPILLFATVGYVLMLKIL